jgi:hypothetical protein
LTTSTVATSLFKLLILELLLRIHVALVSVDRGRKSRENKAVVEDLLVLVASTVNEHLVVV